MKQHNDSRDEQNQLIPPGITKLLTDKQSYRNLQHEHHLIIKHLYYSYHPLPNTHNFEHPKNLISQIIKALIGMKTILVDPKANPYSKLLILRFIRDNMPYAGYTFWSMVGFYFVNSTFQYALYKSTVKKDNRGQTMFLDSIDNPDNIHTEYQLQQIGLSFLRFIIQMHQMIGEVLWLGWGFNGHNQPKVKVMSVRQYSYMKDIKLKFPSENTYYKEKIADRIRKAYEETISSKWRGQNQEEINNFYSVILEELFDDTNKYVTNQIRNQYYAIIISLMKGNDYNCIFKVISAIKDQIKILEKGQQSSCMTNRSKESESMINNTKEKIAIELCHQIFMTGNMYALRSIQHQLLMPMFINFIFHGEVYKQRQVLYIWGILLKSRKILENNCKVLMEVSNSINICEPHIKSSSFKGRTIEDIKHQFCANCTEQQQNYEKMNKFIKQQIYSYSEEVELAKNIQRLMGNYMDNKIKSKQAQERKQNDEIERNFLNIEGEVQSQRMGIDPSDIKLQLQKIEICDEKESGKFSMKKQSRMNYILNIGSGRKSSFSEVNFIQVESSMEEEKPSCRNLPEKEQKQLPKSDNSSILNMSASHNYRPQSKKELSENPQHSGQNQQLYKKLREATERQKQLYDVISQKEIEIENLMLAHSQFKTDEPIQICIDETPKKVSSTYSRITTPHKNRMAHNLNSYYSTKRIKTLGSSMHSRSPKSVQKITNKIFDFGSSKFKRDILKPKTLLFNDTHIQIGITTNLLLNKTELEIVVYVKSSAELQFVELRLEGQKWKGWLELLTQNRIYGEKIGKETQLAADYRFKLKENLLSQSKQCHIPSQNLNNHPALFVQYKKQGKINQIKISLPVFLTKFVECIPFETEDTVQTLLETIQVIEEKQKLQTLSCYLNLDTRVMRKYEDFRKYFPISFQIDARTYLANLKLPDNQKFMLLIRILCKNQIEISMLSPSYQIGTNPISIQILVFKAYCSLFGL